MAAVESSNAYIDPRNILTIAEVVQSIVDESDDPAGFDAQITPDLSQALRGRGAASAAAGAAMAKASSA